MTTLRIYFQGESAAEQFSRINAKNTQLMNRAMQGAAQDTADYIETQGRADISSAGKFGSRWTRGLHARVSRGGANIRLAVTHDVPYFMVYEKGALIKGKPLMWIPITGSGAQGISARNFPGRLFKITSKRGTPILMATSDKMPKYTGVATVTIPKKFHLLDVIRQAASKTKEFYNARFAAGK